MSEFSKVLKQRRSVNKLKKSNEFNQDELVSRVKEAVYHAPSAFNAQSASVMVLFNEAHDALWDEILNKIIVYVEKEKQHLTKAKIQAFKDGDGTILFLEDVKVSEQLKEKFPLYQDNVSLWADQGQGFVQYGVWLTLTDMDLHASLQHYNPLIDDFIYEHYNLDRKYKIIAQMPFGKANQKIKDIDKKDINARVLKKI